MVSVDNATLLHAYSVEVDLSWDSILVIAVEILYQVALRVRCTGRILIVWVVWMDTFMLRPSLLFVYPVNTNSQIVLYVIVVCVYNAQLVYIWTHRVRVKDVIHLAQIVWDHWVRIARLVQWARCCWMVCAPATWVTLHWVDHWPRRPNCMPRNRSKWYPIWRSRNWVLWITSNTFVTRTRSATWMDDVLWHSVNASPTCLDLTVNSLTPLFQPCKTTRTTYCRIWIRLGISLTTPICQPDSASCRLWVIRRKSWQMLMLKCP